jgi:hypothetical protein
MSRRRRGVIARSLKPTPLEPLPDDTLAVGRALLAEDDLDVFDTAEA